MAGWPSAAPPISLLNRVSQPVCTLRTRTPNSLNTRRAREVLARLWSASFADDIRHYIVVRAFSDRAIALIVAADEAHNFAAHIPDVMKWPLVSCVLCVCPVVPANCANFCVHNGTSEV